MRGRSLIEFSTFTFTVQLWTWEATWKHCCGNQVTTSMYVTFPLPCTYNCISISDLFLHRSYSTFQNYKISSTYNLSSLFILCNNSWSLCPPLIRLILSFWSNEFCVTGSYRSNEWTELFI